MHIEWKCPTRFRGWTFILNTKYYHFKCGFTNGIGIPLDNREKIFTAFFTTSEPVGKISKNHEEMTGTGLGLKIVKDIINGYGGIIYVKEPTTGYKTTIRIELPHDKKGYQNDI